jgi:ribosomal protein S18 acetylase RimI-like enzyme
MIIRDLSSKSEILSILQSDRLYAAYPIGDLVDGLFEQTRWIMAEDPSGANALGMIFTGLTTPVLFLMGDASAVETLVREKLTLQQTYLTVRTEHMRAVATAYSCNDTRHMWRMHVDKTSFQPVATKVRRLYAKDIDELNKLYSWGGNDFFAAFQVENGVYYGAEADGRLVAAAGTHVVAPLYGIAAVGNVYTHPDFRGRGFATACTGAVVAELLDKDCANIVLNVRQDNTPAVRAYTHLGFRVHCPFIETLGQRKPALARLAGRLARRMF